MHEVKSYRCDHCNYTKLTKSVVKKHEKICFYNPESMSCATCFHGTIIDPFYCAIEQSDKKTTFCPKWADPDNNESAELNGDCTINTPEGHQQCAIRQRVDECPPFCAFKPANF